MLGFFLVVIALIIFASFFQMFRGDGEDGRVLTEVNRQMFDLFGWLSIIVPMIVLLVAGHFFNSKKLKFVKVNVTLGSVILLIALVG